MATENAIALGFATLEAAGLPKPDTLKEAGRFEQALKVWSMLLSDVEDDELIAAVTIYARSGERFWPTPGALLKLLPRFNEQDDADEAWGRLMVDVRKWGSYQPPGALWQLDPATAAGVMALGGWSRVCLADMDNEPANRASFRAAYRAHKQRKRTAAQIEVSKRLMLEDYVRTE